MIRATRGWLSDLESDIRHGLSDAESGIRHGLTDLESDMRHGLSDFDSEVRAGLKDFESKNREGLQMLFAGAVCAVGVAYTGPAGAALLCMPVKAKLGMMGSAPGEGVLIDPNNPAPEYADQFIAYQKAETQKKVMAIGVVILLAIAAAFA